MSKQTLNVTVGGIYDGISTSKLPGQSVTSGKKLVMNCRFPVDIYEYINTLAHGDGMTKTAVLMGIIREYRDAHPERLKRAQENINKYGI